VQIKKFVLLFSIFTFGLSAGVIGAKILSSEQMQSTTATSTEAERKPIYWQAPMDPSFRSEGPGKSPMGMDLIPVYADEGAANDTKNLVRINPVVENNIGVRVASAKYSRDSGVIETVGTIQIDDDRTAVVDVRTEGWIENMPVKAVGDLVNKGDLLFQLYSRPLMSAQEEFLQAARIGRENLIAATRSRLLTLGMSSKSIAALKKRGSATRLINIRAPQTGIVTMMGVGEGAFVKPGVVVLKLVDLRSVWAIADVFEDQVAQIKLGQDVAMTLSAMPGREWKGKVDYIYPTVNAKARTVRVRISFKNDDGVLRPDMFARLTILVDETDNTPERILTIPREALIRTGKSERVILALGDGRYQPAKVVTGRELGEDIEILSGLEYGENIVVSSQFLIDSEASLRGTLLRLTNPKDEMDMSDDENVSDIATQMPSVATTTGRVVEIMAAHGMITVEHEPIVALGWPAMTMPFLADPDQLKMLNTDDHVKITIQPKADADGNYILSSVEAMDMPGNMHIPGNDTNDGEVE